jgi:hypothetical protein
MRIQAKTIFKALSTAWRLKANGAETFELVALCMLAASRFERPSGQLVLGQVRAHARRIAIRTQAAA